MPRHLRRALRDLSELDETTIDEGVASLHHEPRTSISTLLTYFRGASGWFIAGVPARHDLARRRNGDQRIPRAVQDPSVERDARAVSWMVEAPNPVEPTLAARVEALWIAADSSASFRPDAWNDEDHQIYAQALRALGPEGRRRFAGHAVTEVLEAIGRLAEE